MHLGNDEVCVCNPTSWGTGWSTTACWDPRPGRTPTRGPERSRGAHTRPPTRGRDPRPGWGVGGSERSDSSRGPDPATDSGRDDTRPRSRTRLGDRTGLTVQCPSYRKRGGTTRVPLTQNPILGPTSGRKYPFTSPHDTRGRLPLGPPPSWSRQSTGPGGPPRGRSDGGGRESETGPRVVRTRSLRAPRVFRVERAP